MSYRTQRVEFSIFHPQAKVIGTKKVKTLSALLPIVFLLLVSLRSSVAGWSEIHVPAKPPKGSMWKILPISDDFNYNASGSDKPKASTENWKYSFISKRSGPVLTKCGRDLSYMTGGRLVIKMIRKKGTKKWKLGLFLHARSMSPRTI